MGLGLGILLRSAASSIGVLIGGVMVLPTLAGALLPASLDSVLKFLPSSAAAAFTTVTGAGDEVLGATAVHGKSDPKHRALRYSNVDGEAASWSTPDGFFGA